MAFGMVLLVSLLAENCRVFTEVRCLFDADDL